MCAIFGASWPHLSFRDSQQLVADLRPVWTACVQRGRDGAGFLSANGASARTVGNVEPRPLRSSDIHRATMLIGNRRAEPTTEHVKEKALSDQQPYELGEWAIVHNGTIANDKELRTGALPTSIDSAAIVEQLALATGQGLDPEHAMRHVLRALVGSFAILAMHRPTRTLYVAANYRPIWIGLATQGAKVFASSRHALPPGMPSRMLPPYTLAAYRDGALMARFSLRVPLRPEQRRALVVCSGGLDSTVAAAMARQVYGSIELIHFQYGSRAEGPEVKAVKDVAEALECPVTFFPMPIYKPEHSRLLQTDDSVAGGEAGAEYAHEWVPARNLVMLAIATAYAEANGFTVLVLGNNLEEAGAYPDNEPEFIDRFNDLAPFAVGDGKELKVEMPVGNMMKHEIVRKGLEIGAPLDKTWSCYRSGEVHCGRCGPCFMRRTAFEINNAPEVIQYQE